MSKHTHIPTALAEIAQGRDHLDTPECARAMLCAAQTLRKLHCLQGEAYGVRPIKRGNRLLWPVAEIARVLNGEGSK